MSGRLETQTQPPYHHHIVFPVRQRAPEAHATESTDRERDFRATAQTSPQELHPPGFADDPGLLPASRTKKASRSTDEPNFDPAGLANSLYLPIPHPANRVIRPGAILTSCPPARPWNLLQSHPCNPLQCRGHWRGLRKGQDMARCDGMGQMFEEDEEVRRIIEELGRKHDRSVGSVRQTAVCSLSASWYPLFRLSGSDLVVR